MNKKHLACVLAAVAMVSGRAAYALPMNPYEHEPQFPGPYYDPATRQAVENSMMERRQHHQRPQEPDPLALEQAVRASLMTHDTDPDPALQAAMEASQLAYMQQQSAATTSYHGNEDVDENLLKVLEASRQEPQPLDPEEAEMQFHQQLMAAQDASVEAEEERKRQLIKDQDMLKTAMEESQAIQEQEQQQLDALAQAVAEATADEEPVTGHNVDEDALIQELMEKSKLEAEQLEKEEQERLRLALALSQQEASAFAQPATEGADDIVDEEALIQSLLEKSKLEAEQFEKEEQERLQLALELSKQVASRAADGPEMVSDVPVEQSSAERSHHNEMEDPVADNLSADHAQTAVSADPFAFVDGLFADGPATTVFAPATIPHAMPAESGNPFDDAPQGGNPFATPPGSPVAAAHGANPKVMLDDD